MFYFFVGNVVVFVSFVLIVCILLVWIVVVIVVGFVWSGIFSGMCDGFGWVFGLLVMFLMVIVLGSCIIYICWVWLVVGCLDGIILFS